MRVVALLKLAAPPEVECVALAKDLGVGAYDARMLIAGAPPCIVATLADDARAEDLAQRIRTRGHGVVSLDAARVTSSDDMTSMRRFTLETAGVGGGGEQGNGFLPYEDVFAMLRGVHRTSMVHKEVKVERKFNPGMAIMSGGMMMTGKKKTQIDAKQEEKEGVVYFFRRSGERPWILHETSKYTGLGPALQPTQILNFQRTIEILRERMPFATYDDRLVTVKRIPERATSNMAGTKTETSSGGGVDLLAHLIASWIASSHETPYR